MVRGAKLQYSATITTPTDILFPTTSTLGVLSASRPEEREESARGAAATERLRHKGGKKERKWKLD